MTATKPSVIDAQTVNRVTGLHAPDGVEYDALGGVKDNHGRRILTFIEEDRYVGEAAANDAIVAAFTTPALCSAVEAAGLIAIACDDPRFFYFTLQNAVTQAGYSTRPSTIDPTAQIHPRAFVAPENVTIGPNCIIEANATILSDVVIGKNCIVRAGAVLGAVGYEYKRTTHGVLAVFHDGNLQLGERVEIGANTCIDKGFSWRNTLVGDDTKVGDLVHISHGVRIGKRCFVLPCAMVAGSTEIGDDAWIGPNASVSNGVNVGAGAFVSLGSVVTQAMPSRSRVLPRSMMQEARSRLLSESKLKDVMGRVLKVEAEAIGPDSSMDNVPSWDSLCHMNLVVTLEEEFGVSIADEDAANITSYQLIKRVLEEQLSLR